MPNGGIFISPWTDLEMTGDTFALGAVNDPIIDPQSLANMARSYAGDDLKNPLVSPLHGNVSGFPPSLIFVGTREYLLSDARRLRDALVTAGTCVDYVEEDGLIHCWSVIAPTAPESVECLNRIASFLDRN